MGINLQGYLCEYLSLGGACKQRRGKRRCFLGEHLQGWLVAQSRRLKGFFFFHIATSTQMMARYNPVPEPEVRRTPEIECKTLALAEVTESDASPLLASLATNEKGSSDSTEFSKLTINPERVAKVTHHNVEITCVANLDFSQVVPERIFSVAFHPGEKLVVAAGDKWGKVKGK